MVQRPEPAQKLYGHPALPRGHLGLRLVGYNIYLSPADIARLPASN